MYNEYFERREQLKSKKTRIEITGSLASLLTVSALKSKKTRIEICVIGLILSGSSPLKSKKTRIEISIQRGTDNKQFAVLKSKKTRIEIYFLIFSKLCKGQVKIQENKD